MSNYYFHFFIPVPLTNISVAFVCYKSWVKVLDLLPDLQIKETKPLYIEFLHFPWELFKSAILGKIHPRGFQTLEHNNASFKYTRKISRRDYINNQCVIIGSFPFPIEGTSELAINKTMHLLIHLFNHQHFIEHLIYPGL